MRVRVLVGSVLLAGGILALAPTAALAQPADDPVDLGGAYVLDEADVLDAGELADVRDAIDKLYSERGTQLFVVYVDRFEGAATDQDWAHESAELSGLGDSDVLLAIAVQDRVVRWSVSDSFPVSDSGLQSVFDDRVASELRDDDWAGGAIAFADGVSDAQAPSLVWPILGGVAIAGAAGAGIFVAVRRRNASKRQADAELADSAELERRAGTLLVELDDSLKTSEQELGFAQAQFGEDQTRDFEAVLAEAKSTAKQAFELRQKLDDAYPETPEQRRAMTLQLIELAEKADQTLDAQADAFDDLRQLERNAPQVLDGVATDQAGLAARIDAAEAIIAGLTTTYPDADLAAIAGVPAQARKLTAFAATAVANARDELAKPKGEAAVAVRAAQQAVGQVEQLLASVDARSAELAEAAELQKTAAAELEVETRRAQAQVAAAQDFITTHRGAVGSTARTRISEADRHLTAALSMAASDPAGALSEARDANRLGAAALQAARSDVADYENGSAAQEYGREPRYQEADGASLGGILSDLFLGGGSGRDGGSGWSWGGGGGGWSSSRPSGFGGSSRRSSSSFRRSSGSSSRSSGGRRGGGGRF